MTDEPGSRSRRAYLRRLSAVVGGSALAGCSFSSGEESTRTPREPTCTDGDAADVPALYEWLPYLRPGEYDGDSLAVTAAAPIALAQFPDLRSQLEPYLLYLTQDLNRIGLEFGSLDGVLYARPPGAEQSAYFVIDDPATEADREAWLDRLRLETYVTELQDYRSYERRSLDLDSVSQLGFDDDHVLAASGGEGPVSLGSPARIRRLVDTARGDERPLYCYDPDVRALVERLPRSDLTYAKLRTVDAPFGSGDPIAPPGARSAALSLYLRWRHRELFVGDDSDGTDGTDDASTTAPADWSGTDATETATGTTATSPTPTAAGPDEPRVDLAFQAAFPDEADVDAVRDHVDERWSGSAEARGVAFDDPDVRTDGSVVTVSETRPLASLVE